MFFYEVFFVDERYKKRRYAQCISPLLICISLASLWKADSLVRANTCACAALSASVCVNLVDIALRYSLYWALADTCSTCNAIVANYVSHDESFLLIVYNVFVVLTLKLTVFLISCRYVCVLLSCAKVRNYSETT